MNSDSVSTRKRREGPRMITVEEEVNHSNCSCRHCHSLLKDRNDSGILWSPKNEFAYIVGDGDDCTHKEHVAKPNEEFDEMDGAIAGGEPFLSILDKRRLMKKAEENIEYKWKQTLKPDIEIVKEHVFDLVSKLKKQFSQEKQARKQHKVNAADKAKYVWNNGVDSFLRHHEKPKIEIRYAECSDDQPGEGLFTFAVRPSRIQKRETREKAHVCTVPMNIKEEAGHVNIPENKNEVVAREEVINKNIIAVNNEEVVGTSVHSTVVGPINGDENGHVMYSCYLAPDLLDTFYNHTVTMINKMNALENVYGHVIHQNFETSKLCGHDENFFLPMYTAPKHTYVHGNLAPPIYKSKRYEEIYHKLISGTNETQTSKERKHYSVPTVDKMATVVDICDYSVPPVCNMTTQEVYLSVVLRFCTHTVSSFCAQSTFELSGHSVPPIKSSFGRLAQCLSSHGQPPPGKVHVTSPFNGVTPTEDYSLAGPPPNNETINGMTIVDEFDDDSPFGIMSVYCRSELHSWSCTVSEAER